MSTIFMNSENDKTSGAHRLRLTATDKIDPWKGTSRVALSNLSIYHEWKNVKSRTETINLKYCVQHGMKSIYCLMDLVPYIPDIQNYFKYIIKKHKTLSDSQLLKYISTEVRT